MRCFWARNNNRGKKRNRIGKGVIIGTKNTRNRKRKSATEYFFVPILTLAEGMIFGMAAKMFLIAGPVIVYGTLTSMLVGFLYYFVK